MDGAPRTRTKTLLESHVPSGFQSQNEHGATQPGRARGEAHRASVLGKDLTGMDGSSLRRAPTVLEADVSPCLADGSGPNGSTLCYRGAVLNAHQGALRKRQPSRCIYGATHGRRAVNDLQLALYCRGTSHEGSSVVFGMTVPEHHRAAGFDVPETLDLEATCSASSAAIHQHPPRDDVVLGGHHATFTTMQARAAVLRFQHTTERLVEGAQSVPQRFFTQSLYLLTVLVLGIPCLEGSARAGREAVLEAKVACQVVLSPADVDTASIDASNAVEHRDVAAKVMDMPMLDVESSTTLPSRAVFNQQAATSHHETTTNIGCRSPLGI
mmetsp:Transcript_40026/g.65945  ORF Transcript_40026/g.65945 Transcript_40026/m.65945 type:complete len:326 (-) Transcript_40026:43-1020(-)